MKRKAARLVGGALFWAGWPLYMVYFRLSQRTRILLVRGNEVLVVKSWLSDGRWGLPGGGLGRTEDPKDGVLRELKEELGVAVPKASLTLLGTETYRQYGYRYIYFQYMAEVAGELAIHREWYEIAEARWTDYRELTGQNAGPDVLHAIRLWRGLVQ